MAGSRGGLRGRVWVGHRHHEPAVQPGSSPGAADAATYRSLILRGLAPEEAANLTAYLAGIGAGGSHWTLRQINKLLFLRQMNRHGPFRRTGRSDCTDRTGGPTGPVSPTEFTRRGDVSSSRHRGKPLEAAPCLLRAPLRVCPRPDTCASRPAR